MVDGEFLLSITPGNNPIIIALPTNGMYTHKHTLHCSELSAMDRSGLWSAVVFSSIYCRIG